MTNLRLIYLLLTCFVLTTPARADTIASAERTDARMLQSDTLKESREIFIRTPVKYKEAERYPVVYVLDGEWNFELVAAYLDYMADNGVMPPMIVTGVRNVNRNRDYLPVEDKNFKDGGGAEAFLSFVEDDWAPAIDDAYPASGERILIGHSFGGVFALYAFFEKPQLFNAYIAISASAWIGERALFEKAAARFEDGADLGGRFVYMAPGEFDGGPTRPSGEALAEVFKEAAPEDLDWDFAVIPGADHFKAFTGGLDDAFKKLFPAARFAEEVRRAGETDGAEGVRNWFQAKEDALGYRFYPSWFDFGVAAIRLSRGGHAEAGVELISRTMPYHPEDALFASFAGQVYENADDLTKAESEYRRAIAIAKAKRLHPNVIHLEQLNEGLARIREKQASGASPE